MSILNLHASPDLASEGAGVDDPRLRYVSRSLVAVQIIVLASLPLLLMSLAAIVPLQVWGYQPRWLFEFASGISESLEWTVGTFISVLLAFYAVSVGGQLLMVRELPRVRNTLGRAAVAIAAIAIAETVFVILDAAGNPDGSWGVVAALLVVVSIISFLALNIGFRMTFDLDE